MLLKKRIKTKILKCSFQPPSNKTRQTKHKKKHAVKCKKKPFNIKQNNYFAIISNANCSGEKEKEKS